MSFYIFFLATLQEKELDANHMIGQWEFLKILVEIDDSKSFLFEMNLWLDLCKIRNDWDTKIFKWTSGKISICLNVSPGIKIPKNIRLLDNNWKMLQAFFRDLYLKCKNSD